MAVTYKHPNAISSVWHFRYNKRTGKFETVVNDTYSYVDFEKIISHYRVREGDFVEYGTTAGGGNIFQVRNGARYAPSWGWQNNRAFGEVLRRTYPEGGHPVYKVPVTDAEIETSFKL